MTKDEIETIIKRYCYIAPQIQNHSDLAVYYIGNRKFSTAITDPVITVCGIINEIYLLIQDGWIKSMIKGILSDKKDVALIMDLPWSKNAYYKRKENFLGMVYNCCIAKGLVSYEDILAQAI